jgi:hypothetical protein
VGKEDEVKLIEGIIAERGSWNRANMGIKIVILGDHDDSHVDYDHRQVSQSFNV